MDERSGEMTETKTVPVRYAQLVVVIDGKIYAETIGDRADENLTEKDFEDDIIYEVRRLFIDKNSPYEQNRKLAVNEYRK
mgnify:CR=1 FL=1